MNVSPRQLQRSCKIDKRDAIRSWMVDMHFTHFVTLSSNNQMVTREYMKDKLRAWDARANYALVGPKWQKRIDERMHWIAFPEKSGVNPHWHLLMQLLPEQLEELADRDELQGCALEEAVTTAWITLVPSGTVDVQRIGSDQQDKKRVYDYVTKSLGHEPNLEDFVMFREYFEI